MQAQFRCLSVMQPYAAMVASGVKPIENREWKTSHRGPLLIHASSRVDGDCFPNVYDSGLLDADDPLHRSRMVALVDLVDIIHIDDIPLERGQLRSWLAHMELRHLYPSVSDRELVDRFKIHAAGEWCWILANPRRIESTVTTNGQRGLYTASVDIQSIRR